MARNWEREGFFFTFRRRLGRSTLCLERVGGRGRLSGSWIYYLKVGGMKKKRGTFCEVASSTGTPETEEGTPLLLPQPLKGRDPQRRRNPLRFSF